MAPRRRLRAAAAARAWPPAQVVVLVVKDDGPARRPRRWSAELRAAGHRVRLDDRTDTSFGRRSVDWELKGVPVRVEVGPRDLADGNAVVVARHRREKETVPAGAAWPRRWPACWRRRRPSCWPRPRRSGTPARSEVATLEEAVEAGSAGFARLPVRALGPDGEDRLAEQAMSVRCLQRADGSLGRARRRRRRPGGRRRPVVLTLGLL